VPITLDLAFNNKVDRVMYFEMQAKDPTRAAKFYGDIFGWGI
jgi:predicted enzyme related to lactoylglutathione lyase